MEAARAARSCDYFEDEDDNAPHLPRSRVSEIPPGFRSCLPTGLTSPHPSRLNFSPSLWEPQTGHSHPHVPPQRVPPGLFLLGREARTDPSRLCLSTEFERTPEGAFPAAGAAHTPGTLTLFALRQRRGPAGASAGASRGAPQGVPRVAGDGHGVPCPVVIATREHLPILDAWERAHGSWERGREEMFTCTGFLPGWRLPAQPGVRQQWGALQAAAGVGVPGTLPVLLGDPAATSADKIWVSRISCQPPSKAKNLSRLFCRL